MGKTFRDDSVDEVQRAEADWRQQTLEPDLERRPERRRRYTTRSGIPVKSLYTPADIAGQDYLRDVGFPGQFPFVRGVDPNMYRSQLWTMGQYAGFGSAEESNQRYKYLMSKGATGFSIALDLPTQTGYDSDSPMAAGEVGKVGVAINSLRDMETLLDGVPLEKVRQIRTTANAIGHIMLALFVGAAEKRGIPPTSFNVLLQNDPLKEYIGRGTFIYPPRPAVRLVADVMEYVARYLPGWTAVNVSGYHIRESGATAAQEIAFTFGHARAYIENTLPRGVSIDQVAPGMWVFFSAETDLLEEVAKFRAARRIWARMMRERYGAQNPASMALRFLTFTAGSNFTAQQPMNNIVRATIMGLAGALAGTNTLHVSSFDEALALPSEQAVTISLRTQQIIAEESGVTSTVDPLAGSYYVEALTDRIEREALAYLDQIEQLGGAVAAIEQGFTQGEIGRSAYEQQQRIESKDLVVVGVNEYVVPETQKVESFAVDPRVAEGEARKLARLRAERDPVAWQKALEHLREEASGGNTNLVPATLEAVRAYATVGEIADTLRGVFGEYRDPAFV